jgi:hypothetical protein
VLEYHPIDSSRIMHTNHPLTASDRAAAGGRSQSLARLKALTGRLSLGAPGLEEIKRALGSSDDPEHPVYRLGDSGGVNAVTGTTSFTTGSMISALRADSDRIESWVSMGPPSRHGYARIEVLNH